jgi:hypothetical protein
MKPRTTQTDATGTYTFDGVPAGNYILKYGYGEFRRGMSAPMPPPQTRVKLASGEHKKLDLVFFLPHKPDTHLPTPYGAPPARRRVV